MPKPILPAGRMVLLTLILFALAGGMNPTGSMAQGRMAAPNWVNPMEDKVQPDILVYYFHNTFRCLTCLTMENMAEEMIRDEFDADLETGVLAWRAVNLQNPEFEHFKTRYKLDGPSLVMVEWGEDEELRWKNLTQIWELADSPEPYRAYVRAELKAYLDGEPNTPGKE